jgi:Na+/melibiose symporter-like transporter
MLKLKRAKVFLLVLIFIMFDVLSSLVSISGQTLPPKISVSPKSVNFGSVPAGGTSVGKMVTIKNTGKSDLIDRRISNATLKAKKKADLTA